MSRSPLVTAVIPAYNAERFVADAVESVLAQTYPSVECIVVDDGSTDGTSRTLSRFGTAIQLIATPNGGVSRARNVGIRSARGEFVAFLDADDTWVADKLTEQMAIFSDRPELGMVYSGIALADETMHPVGRLEPAPPQLALRNTLLMELPSATGIGSTGVLPIGVLRDLGGFDERLSTAADCDLTCRVACRHPVDRHPEPLALYRLHGPTMSSDPAVLAHDMLLIFEKLFVGRQLPDDVVRLRRRAYTNLYFNLAAAYRRGDDRRLALHYLRCALGSNPARVCALVVSRLRTRLT
jgi:glycosyltransferase involved in cell wall biosynthesis